MLVGLNGFLALFQSTLSVRRATFAQIPVSGRDVISIHALREESDCFNSPTATGT